MVEHNSLDSNALLINYVNSLPSYTNMLFNQYIVMPNKYAEFIYRINNIQSLENEIEYTKRKFARILEHEIGHVFGLNHASISPHYNSNECLYSIMHQGGDIPANTHPWLPPSEIGEMHRNLHISSARKYVDAEEEIRQYIINNDQMWDWDIKLYGDLIIKEGCNLTISCLLEVPHYSRIIVEPGATLIVDGGTITSAHDDPWQGIEVWGNRNAHQWPDSNGNYQQGRLILNNATIENAIIAVNLWKDGSYNRTGGIVHATNSTFLNNVRSVHALHYINYNPGSNDEMPYNATFTNCSFEINDDYPGYHTFSKHIDLNKVNGLRFTGCDFSLSSNAQGVSDYNQAIAAYSSGFRVNSICTDNFEPCINYKHSTFNNFRVGIYAVGDLSTSYSYYINQAIFNGNSIGILSNNVHNAIIINSEFYAAKNQYNSEPCTYGIFMEAASSFTIEDNKFFKQSGASSSNYIGLGVFNCNANSEVYRNEFTGLSVGNYAYGQNRNEYNYEGVEYICNTNTGNWADFYVTGPLMKTNNGIQSMQGSISMPARNTFSPTGATWHFYNETRNLIGYYYCQNCPAHYPEAVLNVIREPVNVSGGCPSHYGGDTPEQFVVLDAEAFLETEIAFAQANYNYQGVKTLYDNLKDGGSTEATLSDILAATPSQMWEIRSTLLDNSPHLSTDVLKLVADRTDIFTEAVLFDILSANPDELKKEDLIRHLEEKDSPLPAYILDILRQVAEGTSYRTVLEMQMSRYGHQRAQAAGDIIRSILNSEELDVIKLRMWLANLGGMQAERQLITSYAHQGDFITAIALAETLADAYTLEGDQLLDHNQFMSLLQLQQSLNHSGRTMSQLTETEQQHLIEIAASETASSSAMAKGVLEMFYGIGFERCTAISGEDTFKSSSLIDANRLIEHYGISISVKPNPAGDWAAFDYILPKDIETAQLVIIDAAGKKVADYLLQGNMGQQLVDTRKWSSGQYIYTLKVNGFTKTGKLLIK